MREHEKDAGRGALFCRDRHRGTRGDHSRRRTSAGGTPRELGAVALPAAAAGDFLVDAGVRTIIVPLADGRAARIVWR
ncbi:MAG: hypothetical protein OEZ08_09070 [Betaproteobacteria bacterium]|nr:hypothetical protein [Betaproteobacteria bacterium]